MNKYELILHLRELDFREISQPFTKLLGLANGMQEEIYSQHPIYLSYTSPMILSALLILGTFAGSSSELSETPLFFIVCVYISIASLTSFYYLLSSLHGDRKDKSILFWKSLPVSETQNALVKLVVGSIGFSVIATLFSSLTLMVLTIGRGIGLSDIIANLFTWPMLSIAVSILWAAPVFSYVLLVSAAAKRSPAIMFFFVPFVLSILENIFFDSSHLLTFAAGHMPFGMLSVFLKIIMAVTGELVISSVNQCVTYSSQVARSAPSRLPVTTNQPDTLEEPVANPPSPTPSTPSPASSRQVLRV